MCNVSKMVNHIFNAQILIYAFTMLMYFSITTYFIYMEIRKEANILELFDLILIFILDGIVAILKIVTMSYDCECAMRQVKTLFLTFLNLPCSLNQFLPKITHLHQVSKFEENIKRTFLTFHFDCTLQIIRKH